MMNSKPKHEATGVLLIADVIDGDGEIFPKEVVQKMVENYRKTHLGSGWISEGYGQQINDIRGYPTAMELKGDEVHVTAKLDDRGKQLRELGYEFAIQGVINKSHQTEEARVLDDVRITGVSLVHNRVPLKKGVDTDPDTA